MRRIPSDQEIDEVQKYIEYCIQHYMKKRETIEILFTQRNIRPAFTRRVWDKLEQDNPDFFRAYNARLLVKDQIMEFNKLLAKQAEMMFQHPNYGIDNGHGSQGSHASTRTPNGAQSNRQQLTVIHNNGSSLEPRLQENGVCCYWLTEERSRF